jgi:hypothetical protein
MWVAPSCKTGIHPPQKRLSFPQAFSPRYNISRKLGNVYNLSVSSVAVASEISANFLLFSLFKTVFL